LPYLPLTPLFSTIAPAHLMRMMPAESAVASKPSSVKPSHVSVDLGLRGHGPEGIAKRQVVLEVSNSCRASHAGRGRWC